MILAHPAHQQRIVLDHLPVFVGPHLQTVAQRHVSEVEPRCELQCLFLGDYHRIHVDQHRDEHRVFADFYHELPAARAGQCVDRYAPRHVECLCPSSRVVRGVSERENVADDGLQGIVDPKRRRARGVLLR